MSTKPVRLSEGALGERELKALVEASALISSSLDLSATLKAIATSAAEVLNAEASSVLLLDKRRKRLVFEAAIGTTSDRLLGQEMDAQAGIAGRVATIGQPVLVPDAHQHPDFFREFDDKSSFVTRGIIGAPMILHSEVIGVIEVLNRKGDAPFTPRDKELLRLFANLAAISTANAQRHEGIKRANLGLRVGAHRQRPIIGDSAALREVQRLCDRVAGTNATVLLLGETGTGKEVCARAIHERSPRSEQPFVAINCAALPETLLESELFGHEAGAFTGAAGRKAGRFELADRGTLFLDEIGDISPSTQIKLLRVLQEREFVRVGGTKAIACDVRIIAATNRDLKAAIDSGGFREDLYYRLNVFPIHVAPLRERTEDIPALVEYYVSHSVKELGARPLTTSEEALSLLATYRWPGNIRELRNVVERAVLLCDSDSIKPEQLPPEIAGQRVMMSVDTAGASVEAYEKSLVVQALREHDWNQTRAAKSLGMTRDNLRYRMRKYGIRRPE